MECSECGEANAKAWINRKRLCKSCFRNKKGSRKNKQLKWIRAHWDRKTNRQ